mgnify:CR=1 FL=1
MKLEDYKPISARDHITVEDLLMRIETKLQMRVRKLTSPDTFLNKRVVDMDLHRPGLALAGYLDLFTHHRIQIIGNTECRYVEKLSESEQRASFETMCTFEIPLMILTNGNSLPDAVIDLLEHHSIPVVQTPMETTKCMFLIRDLLEDFFAMQTIVHASMMDVYGIGILMTGNSGIGKSEIALDLIERGQRLVADDVVMITRKGATLMASPTEINKHFIEIRGMGIVDVFSMFGIRSVRYQKRVEVVLELNTWREGDPELEGVDRTGLHRETVSLLGVDLPVIRLPIRPGKNLTVIAEVIAMNYLLRHYGYDAAEAFQEQILAYKQKRSGRNEMPGSAVDYFEGDIE